MSLYVREVRGVVNSEISNEFASNLGTMVGNFLSNGNTIVVGRDTNQASQMIKRAATAGLIAAGVEVIDFGVAPIPAIHYGAGFYNAKVVMTVTTSHLHSDEISIKIFSNYKIPMATERAEKVNWENIGSLSYVYDYKAQYIDAVVANVDGKLIKDHAPKVVLDCANASAVPFAPEILGRLGCETILIGCQGPKADERFSEPSPQSLAMISNLIKSVGADIGIAIDNDGDRVIFLDEKGNTIRDQTILGIFAREALRENPGGTVVSSVVASRILDEIVSEYGGSIIKTPVDLVLNGTVESGAVFGGDEPGLYTFPKFNPCFDAVFASVKMLEIICKENKPLSKIAEEIPEYQRTGFSVKCPHEKKAKLVEDLKNSLVNEGVLNTTDGVRVDWEDSYILVRPSRFEPLLRVYMEARSSEKLQIIVDKVKMMI
ncbi:phosphomannomutase [Methanobacterium aggregans]|uniref:phosphomannomutase n=1 Tax=Methanobacterium aggregans TaxID=1615586 RepID=UPI001AE40ED2|nr:phosphomannomutase [Methanobacterium aggregans]MBP2044827.1 phosphomannomutase [Methanobacterium aggregans]